MLLLEATHTLRGEASVASQLTCTVMGMELSGGVQTYKILDQRQLTTVATLYTVPGSTTTHVLKIAVVNNDSVARTFRLFVNGTDAAHAITPTLTVQPGGFAVYTHNAGWTFYTATNLIVTGKPGSLLSVRYRTGGSAYTPPQGCRAIYVEAVGGGGGGGGVLDAATNSAGGGGGGGGAYSAVYTTSMIAYAVTAGAGGAGGAAGANNGIAGGDTTFGSILTAKGGSGGISDTVTTIHVGGLGGAGGLASSGVGDIKEDGTSGDVGLSLAAAQAVSGSGGRSRFGGGAQGRKDQGNGAAAGSFGGGGAGGLNLSSVASQAGGAGAAGCVRIWEFA